jgi:septal ring factor EnvC (AmiA/AmiB activator)
MLHTFNTTAAVQVVTTASVGVLPYIFNMVSWKNSAEERKEAWKEEMKLNVKRRVGKKMKEIAKITTEIAKITTEIAEITTEIAKITTKIAEITTEIAEITTELAETPNLQAKKQ